MTTQGKLFRLVMMAPLLALALAVAFGEPSPVSAAATPCTTVINGGTIKDSIVVPSGADCILQNVVVRGGITIEPGGKLGSNGSEIRGAVTGNNAFRIVIISSVVRGSVTLDGTDAGVTLNGVEVRGDVVVVNTTNPLDQNVIDIVTVAQSVTFSNNQSAVGNRVGGNVIGGTLTCDGNSPAPGNSGSPNSADLGKLGQCAAL